MLENALTDAYLGCLRGLSPRLVARGLKSGLGVSDAPSDGAWTILGRTEFVGFGADRSGDVPTVLIGLTAKPGIQWPTERRRAGSQVDGIIAVPGELVVLLEVKPAVPLLDGDQLERHAISWGLPLEVLRNWDPWQQPADGFGHALWHHVSGWVERELANDVATDAERSALQLLDGVLEEAGVLDRTHAQHSEPARAVAVRPRPLPPPTDLKEIARGWDLGAVRDICEGLWGPDAQGEQVVAGTNKACKRDAIRVIADYRDRGLEPPSGLFADEAQTEPGPVMTPRRLLTAAYSGSKQGPSMLGGKKSGEHGAREAAVRLRPRGVDRYVALALIVWALHDDRDGAVRARNYLARAWAALEPETPAVPELTAALKPLDPSLAAR